MDDERSEHRELLDAVGWANRRLERRALGRTFAIICRRWCDGPAFGDDFVAVLLDARGEVVGRWSAPHPFLACASVVRDVERVLTDYFARS